MGFLAVTAWAIGTTISGLLAAVGRSTRPSSMPRDCERLAPGASGWTPMRWRTSWAETLADACVLADGRVAVSTITTMHPDEPRNVDVWDPATGRWSTGMEVVPPRPMPVFDGPREAPLGGGRRLVLRKHFVGARVSIVDGAPGDTAAASPPVPSPARSIASGGRTLPELEVFPLDFGAGELRDGSVVVVTGDARYTLAPGAEAWARTPLPPLREPRHGAVRMVLADGTIVVAGGLLETARTRRSPAAGRKALGTAGLVGFGWLAVRALAHPPSVLAIVGGVAVGVSAVALAVWALIRAFAWK